ncbi:MAG: carbamoyltransferase HypF, partial [Rhodospirillaceae bacterium]
KGFKILTSQSSAVGTGLPADTGVCEACLKELFDPADRHHLYPFLNCTHCGPRYTITKHLPYDRPQTSMSGFAMCADCTSEYKDPLDRRFHAQPIACPACGPKLSMPIPEIVIRLLKGEILAIKGLGGFHIVCDARNEEAVSKLRQRKDREEKPLAVMVANVLSAKAFVKIEDDEARHLASPMRPIVVFSKTDNGALAPSIAPGLDSIGVLLPYTPLHFLLFHEAAGRPNGTAWLSKTQDLALIMTSANPGGEPLVIGNTEATDRLKNIADIIVTHDRDIVIRTDDSVQRFIGKTPTFIRRARGFVPHPIKLAHPVAPGLAVGAHLKNTICVMRGDQAFVSQHIGDLNTPQSLKFFQETVDHLLSITDVDPKWVACDLHPDFFSSRFAADFSVTHNIPIFTVQHHHAHVASVIAEHDLSGPVLGLALDGFGLGEDGENWGGEALVVDGASYRRVGHLAPLLAPGGEAAFREPWRMAAAVLFQHGREDEISTRFSDFGDVDLLHQMLTKNVNVHSTTSCGRLFDAAAGLLDVQPRASFDGQAPMKLESLVTTPIILENSWSLQNGILDFSDLLRQLIDMGPESGANAFHGTLIQGLTDWVLNLKNETGLTQVVLAGGCLLNRVLTEGLEQNLWALGLDVYRPVALPPGDGGLSLGQAYVGAKRYEQGV